MIDAIFSMTRDGGWSLIAIIATSTFAWSLVLWEWLRLREYVAPRADEVTHLIEHVKPRDAEVNGPAGFLASVRELLPRRSGLSRESFETRVFPALRQEVVAIERPLGVLWVLTASLPLLGLLGTVLGMKTTFVALTGAQTIGVDTIASGISQALITTQAGLILAVPLWLAHGVLAFRVRRRTDEMTLLLKKIETAVCID